MGKDNDKSLSTKVIQNLATLRRHAEERLQAQTAKSPPHRTDDETQRLIHELQVHQIELEMQNAELHQARDEVETALEKYADLYDFAPIGYVTLDRDGYIQAANLAGASILGNERSRLHGRRFALFVNADGRPAFDSFLGTVFASRDKKGCEATLLTKGHLPLIVQIEALATATGQECRLALIDITARRQAEDALRLEHLAAESLRQATEAAEAAALIKSQFLANISHELRTPMTGILGMLQLALGEELDPTPREYLQIALSSARSLLRILNDILNMAKIVAGKIILDEKPFSLRGCVTEAVDIITPELHRKGLDYSLLATGEVPDTVVGDQGRLRQVLINLIGNAVKFTDKGKVTVQITAGRRIPDGKREFTITVADSGIGIPDNKIASLFKAFSQVDESHTRKYGGTGLGLAISKEIVALMEGTITCRSTVGVGSTFSITIPLEEAELESCNSSRADCLPIGTTIPALAGERKPRLLLVEDDETTRQVLAPMLARSGYQLDFAGDGECAVEMWGKEDYDLVLMDIQMPRLDGYEATRAIREIEQKRGCHTPIIAVTAHARQADKESCLAAGMDDFIAKPIDFKKCLAKIRELLDR